MKRARRDADRRRPVARALVALALACGVRPAAAADGAVPPARTVAVGLLAGSAQPVAGMADYQWDIRPHAAWGGQWLVARGPVAAGVRFWHSGTTQALGLPGVTDPSVRANSLELVARVRCASWRELRFSALASAGRLSLTWSPDRATVTSGGTPVEVAFTPVHEWVGGAGLAAGWPLTTNWEWSIETERRAYALDTAHRQGSNVVEAREWFGDWAARVALMRSWDW